jgi:hypothetical protein
MDGCLLTRGDFYTQTKVYIRLCPLAFRWLSSVNLFPSIYFPASVFYLQIFQPLFTLLYNPSNQAFCQQEVMKLYPIIVIGTALQTTIVAVAALQTTNLTGTYDTITHSQQKKLDGFHHSYLWTRKGGHSSSGRGGGKSSSNPDASSGSSK